MNNSNNKSSVLLIGSLFALCASPLCLSAQVSQPATTAATMDEDTVELSPFVVNEAEGDEGYQATTTLAGSRVRTDLKDIGSAISVVTKKLINDVGATNSQTLLQFTTNTEVGGLRGNFSGLGNTATLNESSRLLRPSSNTRVRGLEEADNTRDYFLTEIPWDSYNIDRVEIQRGPNSILFGLGSPAGIVNTSTAGASFKTAGKLENRVSRFGSMRTVLDLDYAILKGELAVRMIGLDDHAKYQQKPAFNRDQRLYGALRYDPKFLRFDSARTSIRANAEFGDVKANRPRMLPPVDAISQFFNVLDKQVFDSAVEDRAGGMRTGSGPIKSATDGYLARSFGSGLALRYDTNSATPNSYNVGTIRVDGNLVPSGAINGLPFYRSMATTAYAQWAKDQSNTLLPGAATGFYKDKSLTDRSTFDFFNELIDGDTARQWQRWNTFNVNISQTFLDNRIGIEAVIDHQSYQDGQVSLLGGSPVINVDTNKTIITGLTEVGGIENPNAGRAVIGGTGEFGGSSSDITRDSKRMTLTGDLRSEDLFGKGKLSRIFGHHVFTGLIAEDEKETKTRSWASFAGGVGEGSLVDLLGDPSKKVSDGSRVISLINYVSGDLRTKDGIANLNLHGITKDIIPHSGYVNANYFDSHWTADSSVDPSAPWTDPLLPEDSTLTRTQLDNPANYKGWTTAQVRVLNADEGDIDALTYNTGKNYSKVTSSAITYQAYLLDNNFVGTFGYRKDKVMQKSGFGAKDPITGVAPMDFDYDDTSLTTNTGYSKSWSFVVHTPKSIRRKLPGMTDISLFYNRSQNFKADVVRGDFMGNLLPNQTGKTKDYGIAITTLDDKLFFKINWYETSVNNATLGGESALGANSWYLRMGETWGSLVAAQSIAGLTQPEIANPGWAWDYASNDLPAGTMDAGAWPRPAAASTIDAKQLAAARAFLKDMPGQSFWDNYGFPINVAEVQQENFSSMLGTDGKMNFTWAWQPAYGGNLKSTGAGPVVTVDTESKGVEYELTAQPTASWNISINASKTSATRRNLGRAVESYIIQAKEKYDGPAGDLRLWGPGDVNGTLRQNWMGNIWYPYQFLKSSEGSTAAEIRPWRFNIVSNYNFNSGALKGAFIGIGERWMQSSILGYGLLQDEQGNYNLDVNQPLRGNSESSTDLWLGYTRKIAKNVEWRIQLNLSNVGKETRLVPISLQPDGSAASYRIAEGMGWQLTNSFSF